MYFCVQGKEIRWGIAGLVEIGLCLSHYLVGGLQALR